MAKIQPTKKPVRKLFHKMNLDFLKKQGDYIENKIQQSITKMYNSKSESAFNMQLEKQTRLIKHFQFIHNEH